VERLPGEAPITGALRAQLARSPSTPRWTGAVVAFVIALQGAMVVAGMTGISPLENDTWTRYDSGLYMDIARDGYELFDCGGTGLGPPGFPCGNAAWFPGYPWLMRAVSEVTTLPLATAGVVVAWLFALATLVALARTFLRDQPAAVVVVVLALAAFWPGQIYLFAVFPLSMLAFFTVLWLWWLGQERWLAAGLAGAGMALSYHLGPLAAPIGLVFVLAVSRHVAWRERARRLAAACLPPLAGALTVLLAMRLQTGEWTGYFQIQDKYASHTQLPFTGIANRIEPVFDGPVELVAEMVNWQGLFVLVLMLALLGGLIWKRAEVTRVEWLVAGVAVVFWLAPLTQAGAISYHRAEATLLPAAVLARHLPRGMALLLVGTAVWIAVLLARVFFVSKTI
jgi:hypothetical protein